MQQWTTKNLPDTMCIVEHMYVYVQWIYNYAINDYVCYNKYVYRCVHVCMFLSLIASLHACNWWRDWKCEILYIPII